MGLPQSGLLPDGNSHAIFLTFTVNQGAEALAGLRSALAGFSALLNEVRSIDPDQAPLAVVALGPVLWDRFGTGPRPQGFVDFKALSDNGRSAPATPADLLLHLRGERLDLCFEVARRWRQALGEAVAVVEEVQGFRYLDSRDLTGFVDGTENPQGDEDRSEVALLGEQAGLLAGGSFVSIQRYIHDLPKWEALPLKAQEDIIARTKADDVEYASEDKPATAHIKRVSIKEDGKSLEILRHSMPYGGADEHGLYFIAYAARPDTFARMLDAMIMADGEGHYDHLMDYSRAVTGANFFAPPLDWFDAL